MISRSSSINMGLLMTSRTIMGFEIPVATSGRYVWTNEFKAYAVARVLEHGQANSAVAKELGLHDNLLRKWVLTARRARGEVLAKQRHFEQLYISNDATPVGQTEPQRQGACKLTIGNATLEFTADMDVATLLELVRELRRI